MRQLTGVLEKLATPELYERNPFFMLGLPVGASSKEIARRKEDIEAEIEMGNASTVFAHYGNVPDEFAIKDAFAALEDPEQKLLYGFFWFWPMMGQVNYGVPTLQQLQEKDFMLLRTAWQEASKAYNEDAIRGRHNLAVLSHFMAMLSENVGDAKAADTFWMECIGYWNNLADDDDYWFLVSEHVRDLNDPRLTTGAVRRLRQQLPMFFDQINVTYAEKYARTGDAKAAKRHRIYMEISQPELDDIDGTTENAFVTFEDQVARLAEEAIQRVHNHPLEGLQAVDTLLDGCRPAANMAKAMSLEKKEIGAALFARIIQTVHSCLICYGNKTHDWEQCLSYTTKAYEYAVSAETQKILQDDVESLKRFIEEAKSKQKAESFAKTMMEAKAKAEANAALGLSEARHVVTEGASLIQEWQDIVRTENLEDAKLILQGIALMLRGMIIQYANKTCDWTGSLDFIRQHLIPMAGIGKAYQLLKNDIHILEDNRLNGFGMACRSVSVLPGVYPPSYRPPNTSRPAQPANNGCLVALIGGGALVYGLFELIKTSIRLFV